MLYYLKPRDVTAISVTYVHQNKHEKVRYISPTTPNTQYKTPISIILKIKNSKLTVKGVCFNFVLVQELQ